MGMAPPRLLKIARQCLHENASTQVCSWRCLRGGACAEGLYAGACTPASARGGTNACCARKCLRGGACAEALHAVVCASVSARRRLDASLHTKVTERKLLHGSVCTVAILAHAPRVIMSEPEWLMQFGRRSCLHGGVRAKVGDCAERSARRCLNAGVSTEVSVRRCFSGGVCKVKQRDAGPRNNRQERKFGTQGTLAAKSLQGGGRGGISRPNSLGN